MQRKTKWITGGTLSIALIGGGTGVAVAGNAQEGDDTALTGAALEEATAAALAETGGGTVTDTESDDGAFEVEVRLDDGSKVEVGLDENFDVVDRESDTDDGTDDDGDESDDRDDGEDDAPLTGSTLEQVTAAALAETGGGTVTETGKADNGGYEADVRLDDGTEVEVELDENFGVVDRESDADDEADDVTEDDGEDAGR